MYDKKNEVLHPTKVADFFFFFLNKSNQCARELTSPSNFENAVCTKKMLVFFSALKFPWPVQSWLLRSFLPILVDETKTYQKRVRDTESNLDLCQLSGLFFLLPFFFFPISHFLLFHFFSFSSFHCFFFSLFFSFSVLKKMRRAVHYNTLLSYGIACVHCFILSEKPQASAAFRLAHAQYTVLPYAHDVVWLSILELLSFVLPAELCCPRRPSWRVRSRRRDDTTAQGCPPSVLVTAGNFVIFVLLSKTFHCRFLS